MNKKHLLTATLLTLAITTSLRAQTTAPATKAQDTTGTPDQRADQLLAELTPQEKFQLVGGGNPSFTTAAIPRLGIPSFVMNDGPGGVYGPPAGMAMPCGAALAATWDPDLAALYGHTIGSDGRVRGVSFQLGPGVNICRVPVNGRNFEYFGEDPYLASIIAMNWTKACAAMHVIPVIKHYAANNQETNRMSVDAEVDERTLHEIYLPAFKKSVQESGIIAVMCAYNRINGHYASNNRYLLTDVLRTDWNFPGLVMSDWGASHDVTDIAMGLDLEMPGPPKNLTEAKLTAALAAGTVKQSDIDTAVHRILRSEIAQGWMDKGWHQQDDSHPIDNPESAAAALKIAQAGIVLLKNDHDALPLERAKIKSIVVLGPNATAPEPVATTRPRRRRNADDFPGPINTGGGGSGLIALNPKREAEADYLKSITASAGEKIKVTYIPTPADLSTLDLAPLKSADAVILCVGLNHNIESEGSDHPFDLPQPQQDLITTCSAANPRTIVINNSGGAVGIAKWLDKPAALLQAWYLGQEGGTAIASVLFGDVNPSGHLPDSFDTSFEDSPAFANYPGKKQPNLRYTVAPYAEGIFVGYRGYDQAHKAPLFPFGFGLSYTTFILANLKVEKQNDSYKVTLDVTNTGPRAGTDVIQLYVGEQNAPIPRPLRELKAFTKISLAPNETKKTELLLPADAFAYWSPEKKNWTTDTQNSFTVEVGENERNLPLKATIKP